MKSHKTWAMEIIGFVKKNKMQDSNIEWSKDAPENATAAEKNIRVLVPGQKNQSSTLYFSLKIDI